MDLRIFDRLVSAVYREDDRWPLDGYLWVFHKYFDTYEEYLHNPHPFINKANIRKLMDKMPYLTCESRCDEEYLDPDSYGPMVERFFQIDWPNCNYNINFFFAGQIREMRFYEVLY